MIPRQVQQPHEVGVHAVEHSETCCMIPHKPKTQIKSTGTTADHNVLSEDCESRNNHQYAVVVQDLATQWIQSYPCKRKNFTCDGKEFTEASRV